MDISLLDPTVLSFLLGFIVPLFVYTRGGGGGVTLSGGTANRLARISNSTTLINSLLSDDGTDISLATGHLIIPGGTVGTPGLGLIGTTTTGISGDAGKIYISIGGTAGLRIATTNTTIGSTLHFTADDTTGASLVSLSQEAAAILQQGADSATPVAQTFKGPDGSGTDIVGGLYAFAPGRSTGNAVPARGSIQGGAATVTSGTTQQTLIDRLIPNAFKVLTNNSAVAVVNATIANGTSIGGKITYTIEVWDGTDNQVETGEAIYSSKNKAGTVAGTITEVNSQQNLDSGTLATTWAISAANPAVISINANSSLTPSTGYPRITFSLQNLGQQAVAIQ